MKFAFNIFATLLTTAVAVSSCCCNEGHDIDHDSVFSGSRIDHIAYPIGGLGAGMFCLEGTGAISNMSVRNRPDLFNEPCMFAAIHVKGVENGTKVVEGPVPDWKKAGHHNIGQGSGGTTWGLPRFESVGSFEARFPFATLTLQDGDLPLDVTIAGWSPFIPNDEDNSGLPAGALEYTFTNTSASDVEAVFSFNSRNFIGWNNPEECETLNMDGGFILACKPLEQYPHDAGWFAVYAPFEDDVTTDCCWFRGGWWDPLTMAWNKVASGDVTAVEPAEGSTGSSLYVPISLSAGQSRTVRLLFSWYAPLSNERSGREPSEKSDYGTRHDPSQYEDYPETYRPWYSTRFASIGEVVDYWTANYDALRARTCRFTETFYDSTLPTEVVRAIADNLTILKSPTVLRQHDGRLWAYEGSGDSWGSCNGTTTHVWNYAQAIPHLFPRLERTLRETEFTVDQDTYGHQMYRGALPYRPLRHDEPAASDGQLGGIIKVYRDWRISGDTEWIRDLYPQVKASLDYCIRTWDPRRIGALEEPHLNTYDIQFWGPDGMCTSFYAAALEAFIEMSRGLGEDTSEYERLYAKTRRYLEEELWNGEYFFQKVRWKDLQAQNPMEAIGINDTDYSPEALALLESEGPKYQYGTGCLSDGIIGSWMALAAGLPDPVDAEKVKGHLDAVYEHNLKKDLFDHADPQRPSYALGHDGGLLLCTWPRGGKPQLPFVYSDEVWTGIEFQVAANLMFEGEVEKGLDIVRTCLDRYDGSIRNPFNEYECGSWYARALSSYSMLQALTGQWYDAVTHTLYINPRIEGDFRSFISTASGFGTVGIKDGKPFVEVAEGEIPLREMVLGSPLSSGIQ